MVATEEDIMVMAELVHLSPMQELQKPFYPQKLQKGVSAARSNNTKSLKGIVVDWITPCDVSLLPPLSWNIKTNRSFHHPVTGQLLCPTGLDWNNDE
jgi:hypothetical protein